MNKIAIPVVNGQLNAHFGHTEAFYIYHVNDGKINQTEQLTPPPHEPGLYPKWLAEKGITDVISKGMGERAIALFNQNKINVFVGVPIKTPEAIVGDFIEGVLETSDNGCDH